MKSPPLGAECKGNSRINFVFCLLIIFTYLYIVHAKSTTDSPSTTLSDSENDSEANLFETFAHNTTENIFDFSTENITDLDLLFNDTYDINTTEDFITEEPLLPSSVVLDFDTDVLCTCDLVGNVCEINCCCDEDCSTEDMKVFVECLPQGLPYDSKYCYQEDIFYKNNSVYKGVKESDSLFCIVHDNLRKKIQFKDVPAYNSIEEFSKLGLKMDFTWTLNSEKDKNLSDIMKAGDALYIRLIDLERKLTQWSLPSCCFGYVCNCEQPVRYMEDATSSCLKIIGDLEMECEENQALSAAMYSNFCFEDILESAFVASTSNPSNTTEDTTIAYTSTQPSDFDRLCITSTDQPKPTFNSASKECHDVVLGVRYDVWHHGSSGITKVLATFDYTSVNIHTHSLTQNFKVYFHWNTTTNTSYSRRSGNPGYVMGLPLIAAIKTDNTNNLKRLDGGLTILKSSPNGHCSTKRETVNFRQNMKSGCLMEKSISSCKGIQEAIFSTLLASLNEKIFVGSFGNSNVSQVSDWVEVFHDSSTYKNEESSITCNLVLNTQIQIAYAAVGPYANPQYKVVGIVHKYDSPQPIDFSATDENLLEETSIYISTSVDFYDVSEPATAVFKSIPVLSAKLPRDFFYPFLLSSAHCISISYTLCIFILVQAIITIS